MKFDTFQVYDSSNIYLQNTQRDFIILNQGHSSDWKAF